MFVVLKWLSSFSSSAQRTELGRWQVAIVVLVYSNSRVPRRERARGHHCCLAWRYIGSWCLRMTVDLYIEIDQVPKPLSRRGEGSVDGVTGEDLDAGGFQ